MKSINFTSGTTVAPSLIVHENRRVPSHHGAQPLTKLGQQSQKVGWMHLEEPILNDPRRIDVTSNLQKPHPLGTSDVYKDLKTNSDTQSSCKDYVLLQVEQNTAQVSQGWDNELNSVIEKNQAIESNNFMEAHYTVTQDHCELGNTQLMLKLTNSSRTTTRF